MTGENKMTLLAYMAHGLGVDCLIMGSLAPRHEFKRIMRCESSSRRNVWKRKRRGL